LKKFQILKPPAPLNHVKYLRAPPKCLAKTGGGGGWGGGEGGAASWEGGAVDGGSVHAFLAAALARVMRVAVPIPAVASASVFE